MKIVISIPDDVYETAEQLAKRLNKSRSEIYSAVLAEYVARQGDVSVTERINAVCAEVDTRPDPFVQTAARRILSRSEW